MKQMSALGRPAAELINETEAAVDALRFLRTDFSGPTGGNFTVRELLFATYGNAPEHYQCSGGWVLPTAPRTQPVIGTRAKDMTAVYYRAHNERRNMSSQVPNVTGEDGLVGGYLPHNAVNLDEFGTEWVFGAKHPDEGGTAPTPVLSPLRDGANNWTYPGGYCGASTDGNAFTRNPEEINALDSPGWVGHIENVWQYRWDPFFPLSPPPGSPALLITAEHGASPFGDVLSLSAEARIFATATPVGIPHAVQRWFTGKDLISAHCEVTLAGMSTTRNVYTRASASATLSTTTTTTTTTDASLILLGHTAASGVDRWVPIATGEPTGITSDKTAVMDCTAIIAAMIDSASEYDTFSIIAGPAADFITPGNGAGALRNLIPNATLSYDAVADEWFISAGASISMGYDSISLGRLIIESDFSGVDQTRVDWRRVPQLVL